MTVIAQDDHLTAGAWAACEIIKYSQKNDKRLEKCKSHDLSLDCVGLAEDVANAYDMGYNSEFRHYRFASATATFNILAWL